MLADVDKIEPYLTRNYLLKFAEDVRNSPNLCETKKVIIGRLIREIVETWVSEDFV